MGSRKREISRYQWLIKDIEIKEQKGELEEAVVLALQNWRDGLIDADDLVAFLVPTRLEEIDRPV